MKNDFQQSETGGPDRGKWIAAGGAAAVRVDKWLWAVRLFKSRSLATAACQAGHVKIGGSAVKPSRGLRPGEQVDVLAGRVQRRVRVLAVLENRVAARLVADYLEDLTPPEEYERAREEARRMPRTPQGFGRPTKRQRRQWERWIQGSSRSTR